MFVRTKRGRIFRGMLRVRLEDGGCGRNMRDFWGDVMEVERGFWSRHNHNRTLNELEIGLILVLMSRIQVLV